jgi:ATP-binding cassette subfamily E protein 1
VVEHDLSVLDFLSDYVCVLYGTPSVYGVITHPSGVYEGINIFLNGFIPSENLRFRPESLTFKNAIEEQEEIKRVSNYKYPVMKKSMGNFQLTVQEGDFSDSEIIVLLGQNGTGKTTFIKMLAGKLEADNAEAKLPKLSVSYKPQEVEFKKDVRYITQIVLEILSQHCRRLFQDRQQLQCCDRISNTISM